MDNSVGELAVAPNDQTPPTPISPLARARVLSGLIMAEALAAERLGRLTDKIAAAMLDANLFSIVVPKAHGGHRQVVGCRIVKDAMDRSTVVGRRDHAAMATPVTSPQAANAWRRAE
jgi:hypothetical protein